jgi:NADPH:quinone reductase-like Zn-dependent oxidoreductase
MGLRTLPILLLGVALASACDDSARQQPATPAAMSAVTVSEAGGVEVLELVRIPPPRPAAGELLVRVQAAGVNPVDTQIRRDPAGWAQLPYTPGFDLSGVVAAVGPGVTRFSPGDAVFAMLDLGRGGAYAEYALVREAEAATKPGSTSHVEAASLPLVALTAWQALFETADLQPGQTVLIHAAAGGVGTVAVQLARWRGARVIATASQRNHAFLRELGADVVIDYGTERFEDVARDVDVVLDPVGGETQARSLTTLRDGGILVSLVGLVPAARAPAGDVRTAAILVRPDAEQLARIAALVQSGDLRPIVSHRLPLSEVAEAHRQSETGHTRGKIVLEVRAGAGERATSRPQSPAGHGQRTAGASLPRASASAQALTFESQSHRSVA